MTLQFSQFAAVQAIAEFDGMMPFNVIGLAI
jgi:hypothetical protein